MHDYFEIKSAFSRASIDEKAVLKDRIESSQVSKFFADMGEAYGTISYLDPNQKADFAEAICEFMDNVTAV